MATFLHNKITMGVGSMHKSRQVRCRSVQQKTDENLQLIENSPLVTDKLALTIQRQNCKTTDNLKDNADDIIADSKIIKNECESILADYRDLIGDIQGQKYVDAVSSVEKIIQNSEDIVHEVVDIRKKVNAMKSMIKGSIPFALMAGIVFKLLH